MACKNTAKEPFRHGRVRECFGSIAISIAIAALVRRTVTDTERKEPRIVPKIQRTKAKDSILKDHLLATSRECGLASRGSRTSSRKLSHTPLLSSSPIERTNVREHPDGRN